ncbi:hypothetical protein Bca101_064974 [Brassica carinata]
MRPLSESSMKKKPVRVSTILAKASKFISLMSAWTSFGVSVSLCLFDSQAVSFLNKLESFCDEPRVTVATSIIRRLTEPIVSWNTDKFLSFCMTAVLEFHFRNTYFFKWSNLQNAPAATAKVAKTARVA